MRCQTSVDEMRLLVESNFWQPVKPAVIVIEYDILKSNSYDIYLAQNQGRDKNLHPPNISWIHDVNEICFLHVTK